MRPVSRSLIVCACTHVNHRSELSRVGIRIIARVRVRARRGIARVRVRVRARVRDRVGVGVGVRDRVMVRVRECWMMYNYN